MRHYSEFNGALEFCAARTFGLLLGGKHYKKGQKIKKELLTYRQLRCLFMAGKIDYYKKKGGKK
ncbi:hypothetical protein PsalMR5_04886 (plasmid) [Piscirickettsia salmonis]|uniref:hypothetical protein n=1 Tax=Piscirickettsia salmonis TaxID=1238 RepID=UPI0012BAB9EF|nr:hypothetical protein [Piscirickettsia salmonis]QGP57367.1 hypothetical protein PsalSR1_04856 [Piscirickettsia salmonis]QGP66961.1 hypothetical protein PsalMR5_04886 [Piscirickettsia salmonis]